MLKTVEISRAEKTRGVAVTYRAGTSEKFGTCPKTCELNGSGCGAGRVDPDYFEALINARPRRGYSFTYTHFAPMQWAHLTKPGGTTVNWSAPSWFAAAMVAQNMPVVAVVPEDFWTEDPTAANHKHAAVGGVVGVRCRAEYLGDGFGCAQCGGEDGPLCARADRDYAILFTAHGASKKAAGDPETAGGCYAAGGNVNLHWQKMPGEEQTESDAEKLTRFVAGLPANAVIRHHVAGDIGLDE